MDDTALDQRAPKPSRMHRLPLAGAVLLAILGGVLTGCASSGPLQIDAVQDARSAYARKEYRKAAELLSVPAMQGNAEAQYALGYLYYYGRGVRKDQYRARAWFEDAARLGHAGAQRALKLLTVYAQMPRLPGEDGTTQSVSAAPEPTPLEAPASAPGQAVTSPVGESSPIQAAPVPAAPVPAPTAPVQAAPRPAPVEPTPSVPSSRALHAVQAPAAVHEAVPVTLKASWREHAASPSQHAAPRPAPAETTAPPAVRPRYTIHLLSSRSHADLVRLVQAHGLADARYYTVERTDGSHYRLIYGGFETLTAARQALETLPRALHAHGPWVNNYPMDVAVTAL